MFEEISELSRGSTILAMACYTTTVLRGLGRAEEKEEARSRDVAETPGEDPRNESNITSQAPDQGEEQGGGRRDQEGRGILANIGIGICCIL